jgi:polar amino acid transport system substrate-binding protein
MTRGLPIGRRLCGRVPAKPPASLADDTMAGARPPIQTLACFTGDRMRAIHLSAAAACALMVSGCAARQSAPGEDPRQALAPTGRLRVAFLTVPIYAIKDPASGEMRGPAVDLGKELARRLGVPFQPVPFTSLPSILEAGNGGEWDVGMFGISPEREQLVQFTAPFMLVEWGYLVAGDSAITSLSDIDRPDVRVAVLEKGSGDAYLSRSLRRAALIRAATPAAMAEALRAGAVHAVAATKPSLIGIASSSPGSRVLEGRFMDEPLGMAVPKDRPLGARHLRAFAESAKAEGLVKAAIERAGLRGVTVAPLE